MAEIILKSMVRVPKDALSIRQIRLIRTGLCLQTQNGQTGKMEKVYGFKESTNYLYLPRQWSGSRRILKRNKIIDQRSRGSKVKLTFHSDKGWRKGQLAFRDEMVCGIRHDKLGGIGKAGCGFGKCQSTDTYVSTERGIMRLGDLVSQTVGEGKAEFLIETEIGTERVSKTWAEACKPALRVSFANGFEMTGSYTHCVRIVGDQGVEWRMLQDLCTGDAVLLRRAKIHGQPVQLDWIDNTQGVHKISSPTHMTPDLCRLLGYLVADGGLTIKKVTRFTKTDPVVVERFQRLIEGLGLPRAKSYAQGDDYAINSVALCSFLSYLGLPRCKSSEKEIPWSVLQSGEGCIRAFLEAYLDCDTGVSETTRIIEICSASKELCRQVHMLLFFLGFNPGMGTKVVDGVSYWRAFIYRDELEKFQQQFNYLTKHKREALARVVSKQKNSKRKNPNWGLWPVTPLMQTIYKQAIKRKIKASVRIEDTKYRGHIRQKHKPTRASVIEFLELFPEMEDMPAYQELARLAGDPAFELTEVFGLTQVESQRLVDLEVPGSNTYVANGVVGHNTVMGCAIAAELGVTTLVIVHTEPIMREWIEAVREFLKIEPGIIQAGRCEFEDRQVVVAMVNSLALKDYPEELYQWPGLVIFDETHHVAARMFLKALTRFPARYYCGLTATPRRQDGLENLFFWTIGGILAEGVGENLDCRVWRLRYYPKIDWDDIQDKNGRPSYSKFLKLLSEDEDRNALLARVAAKAVRQGRKVLLLTKFIDHIEDLRARIDAMFERQTHSAVFATPMEEMHHAHTTGHYLAGKTKKAKAARERARGCDVVLATDRMAKEGFNVPDLDTFILALPMKDIEQAVGRIRRLLEGKKEPMIVEIADEHPFVRGMNEERLAYYRSKLPDKSRWLVHLIK